MPRLPRAWHFLLDLSCSPHPPFTVCEVTRSPFETNSEPILRGRRFSEPAGAKKQPPSGDFQLHKILASLPWTMANRCLVPCKVFGPHRTNICFLFSCKNNTLRLKLANLPGRLANFCSRYGLHCLMCHTFFVGAFDVSLNLRQREVAANRGDLRRAASRLGQPPAHCFSEPVRGVSQRQTHRAAGVAKPCREMLRDKRRAAPGCQESQIARPWGLQDGRQFGVNRNDHKTVPVFDWRTVRTPSLMCWRPMRRTSPRL